MIYLNFARKCDCFQAKVVRLFQFFFLPEFSVADEQATTYIHTFVGFYVHSNPIDFQSLFCFTFECLTPYLICTQFLPANK